MVLAAAAAGQRRLPPVARESPGASLGFGSAFSRVSPDSSGGWIAWNRRNRARSYAIFKMPAHTSG
jgi:hypothetical protein